MERGRFDRLTARTWDLPVWQALARAHGSVLELGCGTGRVLRALHGVPGSVCGVEVDPERVRAARARSGAHIVRGDIRTVRLERRFGLVIVACNTPATGRHVESVEWPGGRRVQSTWYRSRRAWEGLFRETGFRVTRWIDEQGREPDADSKALFCTAKLTGTLE